MTLLVNKMLPSCQSLMRRHSLQALRNSSALFQSLPVSTAGTVYGTNSSKADERGVRMDFVDFRRYSSSSVKVGAHENAAGLIKELRAASGAPIVECKRALEAATQQIKEKNEIIDENESSSLLIQTALIWLRQHGAAKASAKVADRSSTEGLVCFAASPENPSQLAVLLKVSSETDFASRSDTFVKLVETVAQAALPVKDKTSPSSSVSELSKDEIGELKVPSDQNKTVKELMDDAIVAIRENIAVAAVRQLRIVSDANNNNNNNNNKKESEEMWVGYVHNRVNPQSSAGMAAAAVLIQGPSSLSRTELEDIGKKLAMHVVAARPQYLRAENVPETILEREKEILRQQIVVASAAAAAAAAGGAGGPKPAKKSPEILEKILKGRLQKFLDEICLLEQSHMVEEKNPKVGKFLESKGVVLKQYDALFLS